MATAAIKKPALGKTVAKPGLKKPAAKDAKATKIAKPTKEVKPFEVGEVGVFKGYTTPPKVPFFTAGEELAVVDQREEDGILTIACVRVGQYHKYTADPDNTQGAEILASELRRTGKTVPPEFHLTVVGDMEKLLRGKDPLEVGIELYSTAQESFFYLGGVLAKLYREIDDETGNPLFCTYTDSEGANYEPSKEGFERFIKDNFGEDGEISSMRKAQYFMAIYESFSALDNAAALIKELPKVRWWKASKLAQYITNKNATELVKIAQEQSDKELTETLKTKYTTEGNTAKGTAASRHSIKRTTFTFKLYEDAGVAIDLIMKAAGKQLGIQDLSAVFEHIVQEWGAEKLGDTANKAKAATERARNTLRKQGVKLPADHPAAKAAQAAA